jgi:2,3-bisphosphoglycerate-dependent phosphoglycerate mutase
LKEDDMRICMMRHGEAQDDIDDCYGGIADFPLTDKGRDQARQTAALLVPYAPTAIYSSPLKRAHETAAILAEVLGLPAPTVIEDLQERNSYGVLSGVNKDTAKLVFGNVLAKLKEKPGYSKEPIPGCELWDDFVVRVRGAFEAVVADASANGHTTIGVVTHGKFTAALFEDVLHVKEPYDLKLSALNILRYQPSVASLAE